MPDDAPAIAAVMRAARAAAMPWLPVLHGPDEDLAYFGRQVEANAAYVAVLAGRVVGFAVVDEREQVLEHLYLDPPLRRRGIGAALVAHARTRHPGPLELWCFRDNTDARAFYRAQGGLELFETDGSDNEEKTPDVRLRLPGAAQ